MSPTLNPESSLLEEDIVLIQRNPFIKRQDIVILKHPNNSSQLLCKRVKGLHGDRITPRTKTRWLGLYDRDDSDGIVGNVDGDVIVGEGEGWMEGDEPYVGMDSNQLGSLPLGLITAKVIAIVYPIHRIRFI